MDSCVETLTVNEHQLFNIPRFVEDVERCQLPVKEAGVFKILLQDSIKGHGTPLETFVNLDQDRLTRAEKQFAIRFAHCPLIFGLRSYSLGLTDESDSTDEDNDDDCLTKTPCTTVDIDNFVCALRDEKNYVMSSCCATFANDSDGLVDHFFSGVLPQIAVNLKRVGPSISQIKRQGKSDAASVKKFFKLFDSLPIHQKHEVIKSALVKDTRITSEAGCCQCCFIDNVPANEKIRGVMYASAIETSVKDMIRMSQHFGLYCLASSSLLRLLPNHYPGITSPFLYYGSTHSFFAAHIEDYSLYSINFLHYGAPKIWLVVPPKEVRKLNTCLAQCTPNINHSTCVNQLGHKYFVVTPQWLTENGITFKVVVQKAGEGVIVCPNAVHLGFNTGFNIAESCNFATDSWIPYGIVAPRCRCIGAEAHLDIQRIVAALRPDLLQHFVDQTIPVVPKEDDPFYYSAILKDMGLSQSRKSSCKEIQPYENNSNMDHDGDGTKLDKGEDFCNSGDPFPTAPSRPEGRKALCCPKPSCSKQFLHGKRQRLLNHVKKCHPDYENYQEKMEDLFPERNKTVRQTCNLCGKLIAGRAAQLRRHQKSSTCKKTPIDENN